MVTLALIIVILTFLVAVQEVFTAKKEKNVSKARWFLSSRNITLVLLGFLLVFQFVNTLIKSKSENIAEQELSEAFTNIRDTKDSLSIAIESLKALMSGVNEQISASEEELVLIRKLNSEINHVRSNLANSLSKYQELSDKYSKQLNYETDRLESERPNVKAIARVHHDSLQNIYQVVFRNTGKRIADSLIYYAALLISDSIGFDYHVFNTKSNFYDHNAISIPGNNIDAHIINIPGTSITKELNQYFGYLIIRYSYYDALMDSKTDPGPRVFRIQFPAKDGSQLGVNVDKYEVDKLRSFIVRESKLIDDVLFK